MGIFGYSREFKGDQQVRRRGIKRRVLGPMQVYWTVFFCAFIIDGLSKWLITQTMVLQQSISIMGDFLKLTYVHNSGTVFQFLAQQTGSWKTIAFVSVAISVIFVVTLVAYREKKQGFLFVLALGLLSGGITGNLLDRLLTGAVIDFIDIGYKNINWSVFNLADTAVVIGVSLLLMTIFSKRLSK